MKTYDSDIIKRIGDDTEILVNPQVPIKMEGKYDERIVGNLHKSEDTWDGYYRPLPYEPYSEEAAMELLDA